jgi:hypothetical protein
MSCASLHEVTSCDVTAAHLVPEELLDAGRAEAVEADHRDARGLDLAWAAAEGGSEGG